MAEALINRGTTWTDKEVKALLAIWGDSKIQEELDGAVRNQVVFKRIAQKLSAQGIQRDWKQCRVKVKNLYREIKDNNGKTGRGRQSCKFFNKLDEILGHRPASVPSVVLDTGESSSTHPEIDESDEEEETDGKSCQL
jgi:phosphoribosylaminoimidazole carboxylase/phosphoribosylaminoimidazole-succinocarboxamide synthase